MPTHYDYQYRDDIGYIPHGCLGCWQTGWSHHGLGRWFSFCEEPLSDRPAVPGSDNHFLCPMVHNTGNYPIHKKYIQYNLVLYILIHFYKE